MRPPSDKSVIEKCTLETEKLFQAFLDVDQFKGYKETEEVGYFRRENDAPPLRSGSFGSTGVSGLLTRGAEDVSKYNDRIEEKRRSFGSSGFSNSYPSLASVGASIDGESVIETDSGREPIVYQATGSSSVGKMPDVDIRTAFNNSQLRRPMSGDLTSTRRSLGSASARRPRSRTDSIGPSDELIKEAARKIAEVGDKIEQDYKEDLNSLGARLEKFITEQGSSISYEVFAATVNDLVGTDRNWTNLVFVMNLGKRVVTSSASLGTNVRTHFAHFIGMAFGEEIARVGNAEQYVRAHTN